MKYLSVCSGIEAATVAWQPLGWTPVAFAEVDPFACAVLRHHHAGVPNLGDIRGISSADVGAVDNVVGGTPCQSFSVAGLRGGLADPRGNLVLDYLRLLDATRARWCVWENVPGVLSVDGGRAFGAVLGGLGELGYGFAYRVLDAQYFGIPQRRRRVFLVGHLGSWQRAAAVLFERASLHGHPPPRREAGQGAAAGAEDGARGGVALSLAAGNQRLDGPVETFVTHSLRADGFDAGEAGTGRGTPLVPIDLRQASRGEKLTNNRATGSGGPPGHGVGEDGDPAFTVSERGQAVLSFDSTWSGDFGTHVDHVGSLRDGNGTVPAVAFDWQAGHGNDDSFRGKSRQYVVRKGDYTGALGAQKRDAVATPMAVRRLTPVECERLQGFPDDYTLVPYRGKPAADGPRYRALGNSMAVPVVRWIGRWIQAVEAIP